MGFFKKLFGYEEFIPTPRQTVPGLEPIVVQAVENLFPNPEEQKQIFEYFLKRNEDKDTFNQLARLRISKGKLDRVTSISSRALYEGMVDYNFSNMRKAEKWVKSLSKSQV